MALFLLGCGSKTREAFHEQESESVLEESVISENEIFTEISENEITAGRPAVRGIYVTGPMAGVSAVDDLITLVDETQLNALIIDVKNDEGRVVYEMDSPTVNEIGSVKRYVRDMGGLIQKCKEKDIYLIARIVAFKDPFLAEAKPEWSLHNADGSIFRDKSGQAWVNPYKREVWDYLLEIAGEAVSMGFDEIQFDYIRFSTDSGMKNVDFGEEADGISKTEAISAFSAYVTEELHKSGTAVSADVYGVVIGSEVDQKIVGQDYVEMAKYMDYLSPMVYPSHYGPNCYGIEIPDARPYETVLKSMQDSRLVLAGYPSIWKDVTAGKVSENSVSQNQPGSVSDNTPGQELTTEEIAALAPAPEIRAKVRPWLQDFTATWVKGHISYGPEEIRQQIQAVYDAGYEEWILWNAANHYTKEGIMEP